MSNFLEILNIISSRKRLVALLLLAAFAGLSGAQAADSKQPNIIFILADDMGIGDISAFNSKSGISTPNLDELATNGAIFTDAFTPASVCTPTRYAILTGEYAWRTRLKSSVLWSWEEPLIEDGTITLAELLKSEGYSTAMFGKWHLGWTWPTFDGQPPIGQGDVFPSKDSGSNIDFNNELRGGPIDHGFESFFGVDVPNFAPYGWIENDKMVKLPTAKKPASMYGANGPMVPDWQLSEITPTITARIVEYIESRKYQRKPFFLYYALTSPHTPIAPTVDWIGTSKAGLYGDFVQQMDDEIGQIYDALSEANLEQNTIFIFIADNGSAGLANDRSTARTSLEKEFSHETSLGLKGYKTSIHEGGFRVPMIVVWPERIEPGTKINQPFNAIDFYATLADIVDAEMAQRKAPDSISEQALLTGDASAAAKREHSVLHSFNGSFALRQGSYKLVAGSGDGTGKDEDNSADEWFLYDLKNDSGEENSIAQREPELFLQMQRILKEYMTQSLSVR